MHSLFILTLCSLFSIQDLDDRVVGQYKHDLGNSVIIRLILCSEHVYSLMWIYEPPFQFNDGHNISFGTWEVVDKEIVLTDREHGFISTCTYKDIDLTNSRVRNNFEITIDKSFKWLTGLKFEKFNDKYFILDINDYPFKSNINPLLAQKEREQYQNDKSKNTLFFGNLAANRYQQPYQLWIGPNRSYILYSGSMDYSISQVFRDTIFSEGTWERKGNLLILYDTSVKCHFYLLITYNGLKSNQMMYSITGIFQRSP